MNLLCKQLVTTKVAIRTGHMKPVTFDKQTTLLAQTCMTEIQVAVVTLPSVSPLNSGEKEDIVQRLVALKLIRMST